MATSIANNESGSSVRTKLNNIWEGLELNEIAATIADTAVDIFVYDTRKDSDGGAWRKRTQHTSWYNETLNTATRGSRKEFPAVAVIVAESNQITIYDGDDPDMPMWMVFNVGGTEWATNNLLDQAAHNSITSVAMLNGLMVQGSSGSYGARTISFLKDNSIYLAKTGFPQRQYDGNIAERNAGKGSQTTLNVDTVISNYVNDVAMTVLPNAPIDAATGLPVPTIAVATDGGVSVIRDDGTVVDSSLTIGISSVSFTENNALVYNRTDLPGSAGDPVQVQLTIPTADGFTADQVFGSTVAPASNRWNNPDVVGTSDDDFAVGSGGNNIGFNYISNEVSNKTSGMTVQVTSEFNSGWQNGDIKLATLSDTDATNVTGSELVTNGTFDTDTSGWSAIRSASISIDSARLKVTNGASDNGGAQQAILDLPAGTYVVSVAYDHNSSNTQSYLQVGTASDGADLVNTTSGLISNTATGVLSGTFTLSATTTVYVQTQINAVNGANGLFDNVTLRLAEEDRSVNGNGLQVFGTVTKSAVATGADLVAYSGFSASNYLEQPYNADLEVGTGDISFMGWVKKGSSTGYQIILQRDKSGDNVGTGSFEMAILNTTGQVLAQTYDGAAQTATSTSAVSANTWSFICGVIDAGVLKIYFNGVLEDTVTPTALSTSGEDVLTFGIRTNHSSNPMTTGSLALWRISATAPSPEAIKRIYEDEKVLFQENAKAVLYGTSDAVTALAFDDSNGILSVGTSAGRSDFQGLRRVNNTTTAVTSAISASNGLIVEQ